MAQPTKTKKGLNIQAYVMVIALLAIWAFFHLISVDWGDVAEAQGFLGKINAFFSDGFLQARNLSNISRQFAITGVTAIGMVYVIIGEEIDLSIGSQIALLGGVLAVLDVAFGLPPLIVIPLVVISGCILGMWNGYWVAYLKVPSFIVTLAGMMAFRGLATIILGSATLRPSHDFYAVAFNQYYFPGFWMMFVVAAISVVLLFSKFKNREQRAKYGLEVDASAADYGKTIAMIALLWFGLYILNNYRGVPTALIVVAVLATIMTWVGRHTTFGRYIYAMGGNNEATRLSGVNVRRTKMFVFMINGLMASAAAIILVGRVGSAAPSAGSWQELYTIAACFIGGTSMRGGIGTVFGALTGGLIMTSLQTGMQMQGVNELWQSVIIGMVLLLAVFLDIATREGGFKQAAYWFKNITKGKAA